ncbi:MAG: efflux RND transporter periplasmic adaptor subunit, partial [Candidatus Omnitrophota bacterium]
SNVTIYQVDILSEQVPDVFRSGMSASVKIIQESRDNALLIPTEFIQEKNGKSIVFLVTDTSQKPSRQEIKAGFCDGTNTEVLSGLATEDTLVDYQVKTVAAKKVKSGSNPFMPTPPGAGKRSSH